MSDPEDFDTALCDYVHARNELDKAIEQVARAQRAVADAEVNHREALSLHAAARSAVGRFVSAKVRA